MHRTIVRLPLLLACAGILSTAFLARAEEPTAADSAEAQRPAYVVEALAAQLATPQAAFAFVRDQIAPEPYAGVMKGAAGALLTRGGNDWDRALLLAKLLAAQGIEARLAGSAISARDGQTLTDSAIAQPDGVTRLLASLPKSTGPASPQEKLIAERLLQHTAARTAALASLETAPRVLLQPVVASLVPALLPPQTERVWVRAMINGNSVDLNPSWPTAEFGVAPPATGEVWESGDPRDDAWHTLTVKLVAARLGADGELQPSELLTRDFRAADLVTTGFRLVILPRSGREHAGDFRARLLAGEDSTDSESFRLSGESSAPAESGGGGLFGGLGGEEEPSEPAAKKPGAAVPPLARLWVEFTLRGPGLPDETFRRTILDRTESAGKSWRLTPALAADERVRPLLLQAWDGALDVGAPHPAAVLRAGTLTLKALEPVVLAAKTGTKIEPGDIGTPSVAPQLLGFFVASGLRRHALGATTGAHVRLVQVRPRVALLRHGFEIADWTGPGKSPPRYREGIDLVNTPFRCSGPVERAVTVAAQAGIADTALEVFALRRPADWNTLPVFAAAQQQKLKILTLHESDSLTQVEAAAPIRAALAAELATGHPLVVPRQPVAYLGGHAVGWWSVDPASGYALGRLELGGGQGFVEVTKMHERITDWTEIFGKFYGNLMHCFMGELGNALGSVEPDWANLDVKVTVNHGGPGETPMPSANQLTQCAIDAACEALSDLLTSYLSEASAAEGEAEALREMIAKWINEKAIEKAGEATSEGCNNFLSNAAGTKGGE